jgi:hypothetical protein
VEDPWAFPAVGCVGWLESSGGDGRRAAITQGNGCMGSWQLPRLVESSGPSPGRAGQQWRHSRRERRASRVTV